MSPESASNLEKSNVADVTNSLAPTQKECLAIVGIGASAGGLDAFTQLLSHLPPNTGMGFVLIQHLSPQYASQLSEILQRSTEMPVNEAQDGMSIAPNCVYVIPPNTSMTLAQGLLKLKPRQKRKGRYTDMVINEFFHSLAMDCRERAIAVVLSGSNDDGTAGLEVIKSLGGITFAQDPESVEFSTMPMNAISSGYVDFVLAPAEIATELVKISQSHHEASNVASNNINDDDDSNQDNDASAIFTDSGETLQRIFLLLQNAMAVDFSHYKKGTIKRRLLRRMRNLNLQNLEEYRQYLQEHPQEIEKLYQDLLINVTSFFRDPASFQCLHELVFPAICQDKPKEDPIRIWVVGCATGEEAYSIAISWLEFFDDIPIKRPIHIFATDISEVAIKKASLGIYTQSELTDVSPERLWRFFTPVEGGYQIGKSVRELCIFARQNLICDPPFSRLDLISCRNMLIYFEPWLQNKVMPIFHYALNPNGFLMLGSSEGIGNSTDLFAIANKKHRIYKRKLMPTRMSFNFGKSTYISEASTLARLTETTTEVNLEQLADQVVLRQYAPVGVMLNVDLEILQFRGETSPYLAPSAGKASLNLLKMVRPELRLELRSAIHYAKQQNIPICKEGIEMSTGCFVKIDVIPLRVKSDRYFLVLFDTLSKFSSSTMASPPLAKSRKVRQTEAEVEVTRLTHELENTKEYLRTIIDAQEVTNQDLKVASEEFLSSNEELQSTNEELETAKEEIQATNEELNTINDELRNRNIQLHQVNNDLQNLLNSVNIPILMLSGSLRIRRFTPLAEQLFNLISSDIGRPFSDIQPNINVPNLIDLMTVVRDTLVPYEQDVQDRSGHWYILRIRPYRTTDNQIDGVVTSLIDIDLLKRNTIDLEASRNYVNAILETLRQPLLVLNADLYLIKANSAFYQFFPMYANQTKPRSLFELGQGEWDIPKLRSLLNDILTEDISVQDYEITQYFPQLGNRTMLINACQIYQANTGKMILMVIEDITETNQQKQELISKNQALTEAVFTCIASDNANRAKSEFLGNISHELRTPLNTIMGFAQILQSLPSLDSEAQEFVESIYQAGEHLSSLIADLLDIARIEADKIVVEPKLVSLSHFLESTVNMIHVKAIQKNLTFTTQFASDLPEQIYADEKCLRQVLLNLLSNAIKFTDAGEITFAVNKYLSTNQAGNVSETIQFAIADTGIGIAPENLAKIFLPFEQVCELKMRPQGAGLGLAISQTLVKKMGGEIKVVSKVGAGSIFRFELDLSDRSRA